MNGGFVRNSRGFTIVETLIVLAVSMALFLSAVALINGRQHTTAFNQSVGALRSHLQQIASEVSSGYYENDGSLVCDDTGGKPTLSSNSSLTENQGKSEKCLFLGKVVQFGVPNTGTGLEDYIVYTLVGLNSGVTGGTVDLKNARARVIAQMTSESGSGVPDTLYTRKTLQYGLSMSQKYYNTYKDTAKGVSSIGFITNLSSLGAGDGSQRTDMVAFKGTTPGSDKATGATQIYTAINTTPGGFLIDPSTGIKICFNSGGTNKSAEYSLGGTGRQGTVDVKIWDGLNCGT